MSVQGADEEMADSSSNAPQDHGEEIIVERQRLRLLPGATETAASFAFEKEDHTLGNALRYIITKNPAVEFCGYSIPHPSEAIMNLRIQTWDDVNVLDVLRDGLKDLVDLCDAVEEKFTTARDSYNASHPESRQPGTANGS